MDSLERTTACQRITLQRSSRALAGRLLRYAPRFLPLAERLSRSASVPTGIYSLSYREIYMCVTEVHSTYASIGLGGDITWNSHPDIAAFQLIRQVTPASV
ncbi:hypothetical protein EV363DRAFT_1166448 [Boletus edulis]|nr:hypothetical protein EV363DRAFT_1166448 [Boletus edulis]